MKEGRPKLSGGIDWKAGVISCGGIVFHSGPCIGGIDWYCGLLGDREDGGGKRAVEGTAGGTPAVDCGIPGVAAAIPVPGATKEVDAGGVPASVGVTGPANVVDTGGITDGVAIMGMVKVVAGAGVDGIPAVAAAIPVPGTTKEVEAGGVPADVGVAFPANVVDTGDITDEVAIVGVVKIVDGAGVDGITGAAGADELITNEPAGEASSGAEFWRLIPEESKELEVRNGDDPGAIAGGGGGMEDARISAMVERYCAL